MSDYTDDMLEGVFCQVCGEYLGEGDGYPAICATCQAEEVKVIKEKEKD